MFLYKMFTVFRVKQGHVWGIRRFLLWLLLGNIPIRLLSFCLLKLQKNMDGKEKTVILFNSTFIFGVYDYFVVWECFPKPEEITVLSGQGVRGISGIIFGKFRI